MPQDIYAFDAQDIQGQRVALEQFRGKVLLIVNTASACGFTPQFAGLEQLHQTYADRGLVVLGFPCNQFGSQDPGSNDEIASFCQLNYGVTFQIMKKVDVNGSEADPIFKYLKAKTGGWFGSAIKWNFTKFLISRDGKTVKRYAPVTKPEKLEKDIRKMLG